MHKKSREISSKIIVEVLCAEHNADLNASINLDNSPPDAILCIGAGAIPGFIDAKNTTLSVPVSVASTASKDA